MQLLVDSPFERPVVPPGKLSQFHLPDIVTPIENTIYPQVATISGIFIAIVASWMMVNSFKN